MTSPGQNCRHKRLSKGEGGEQVMAATDQRNLTVTVSIAGIAAEVENERVS
jgi:hypothetical protein